MAPLYLACSPVPSRRLGVGWRRPQGGDDPGGREGRASKRRPLDRNGTPRRRWIKPVNGGLRGRGVAGRGAAIALVIDSRPPSPGPPSLALFFFALRFAFSAHLLLEERRREIERSEDGGGKGGRVQPCDSTPRIVCVREGGRVQEVMTPTK